MRTQMHVEISGDALTQLFELDEVNAPVAERLLEKMWNGSLESFTERARESTDGGWKIRRRSVEFRVLVTPAISQAPGAPDVVATVVGVRLV